MLPPEIAAAVISHVHSLQTQIGSYRKRHLWHGIPLLAFFVFAGLVPLEPENHVSHCIMERLFGLSCPFCGLTRALGNLYHGNILTAWKLNPVAFIFLPLGVVLLAYRGACVARPRWIRIPLWWELAIYIGVFGLFVIVWIVRTGLGCYA